MKTLSIVLVVVSLLCWLVKVLDRGPEWTPMGNWDRASWSGEDWDYDCC
jgi:hypothetical protein